MQDSAKYEPLRDGWALLSRLRHEEREEHKRNQDVKRNFLKIRKKKRSFVPFMDDGSGANQNEESRDSSASVHYSFRVRDPSDVETKAKNHCIEMAKKHRLAIEVTNVVYRRNQNKYVFHYLAEKRIDLRPLMNSLSLELGARIDMSQIGVREKAGILGGCGTCGRPLCCSTWLRSFKPVTLNMAKKQNLNLNPYKLSGLCGRLKCCLRYELDR